MIEYENLNSSNAAFFDAFTEAFQKTLHSGWYILGEQVKTFEKSFAGYCEVTHCCGVANGLDALTLSLKALGGERGMEVIVPSNTYIATILSILHNDMVPVLVEPDIETYNMDPEEIEARITENTFAIMPVHLYGKMCDMDPIMALAEKNELLVIEDCAQAHGARYKGKRAGSFGHLNAFSFYPTKNLGALGDAGAVTSSDSVLDEKVRTLRNYGSKVKYYNEYIGYNSRLDELQAAFLNEKLKHLDEITVHKQKLAGLYSKNLKGDFILPQVHADYDDVFHIYAIRHPKRDQLKEYLFKNGIKTEIHYPVPPVRQKAMIGILDYCETPIAEEIHATTLSLPISFGHKEDDIFRVIEVMNKF